MFLSAITMAAAVATTVGMRRRRDLAAFLTAITEGVGIVGTLYANKGAAGRGPVKLIWADRALDFGGWPLGIGPLHIGLPLDIGLPVIHGSMIISRRV